VILEEVAELAWRTVVLDVAALGLDQYVLDKHFHRKHGPGATYGQPR
jgi:ribulose-5-phosphate 4-epimerase/fuculose-1-phosphate aldolase